MPCIPYFVSPLQGVISSSPNAASLEIFVCPSLTNRTAETVCPLLGEELTTVKLDRVQLGDEGLRTLLSHCSNLRNLHIVNCKKISKDCLQIIGSHCKNLTSLSFDFGHDAKTPNWSINTDALSNIVKFCAFELVSISLVGFKAISDIGVNYAAECYYNSLQKVNFNYCSHLTDNSITGLTNYCKLLREASFAGTGITATGIQTLASKCPKLTKLNIESCKNVRDSTVKFVAQKCPRLEDLNVSRCSKLTESSLVSLTRHCPNLKHLSYGWTGLSEVPVAILALQRLRSVDFQGCSRLQIPPPAVLARGVEGIWEYFHEYQLCRRYGVKGIKVFYLIKPGPKVFCCVPARGRLRRPGGPGLRRGQGFQQRPRGKGLN